MHGVPGLPEKWVARPDEVSALMELLLGNSGARVGITSAQEVKTHLGLHGMGGIGKTELAKALAHDEEVRRHFSDGIYWVTLGQDPPLFQRQAELVQMLTGVMESFENVATRTPSRSNWPVSKLPTGFFGSASPSPVGGLISNSLPLMILPALKGTRPPSSGLTLKGNSDLTILEYRS